MARRRMSVVAAVAGVAILGGAGSAALERYRADPRAEFGAVASALHEVNDVQQRTAAQLAGISLDVVALREKAAAAPAPPAPDPRTEPSAAVPAQLPPLPPAVYVRPHPYPPPPGLYQPAYSLRPTSMPGRRSIHRSSAVSAASMPLTGDLSGS